MHLELPFATNPFNRPRRTLLTHDMMLLVAGLSIVTAAVSRLSGNDQSSLPGSFQSARFANRLEAGDGVGFSFGIDIVSF